MPLSPLPHTWLITGTSSGLGHIMVEQLLERGDRVAALSRTPEKLENLARRHGDRLWRAKLDLSQALDNPVAIREAVNGAFAALGTIDVIISNAGYALLGAAENLEDGDIARQISTNMAGPIQLIRAALPHLRAQGSPQHGRRGHIIQLSSEGGQMAYPAVSLYHATKWGIEGFCESLMLEVAPFNIAVTLVQPGRTATEFDAHAAVARHHGDAYRKSTVGHYLRLLDMGKFPRIGDPMKVVQAILALPDMPAPPKRLTLGSDSYRNIHRALSQRLAELERQKESAPTTDRHADDTTPLHQKDTDPGSRCP